MILHIRLKDVTYPLMFGHSALAARRRAFADDVDGVRTKQLRGGSTSHVRAGQRTTGRSRRKLDTTEDRVLYYLADQPSQKQWPHSKPGLLLQAQGRQLTEQTLTELAASAHPGIVLTPMHDTTPQLDPDETTQAASCGDG